MHRKAIVHIMTKARMKSDAFTAEIDCIEELSEKYGIKNVIYYKGDVIEYKDLINKLEKFGILLYNYSNKEELKEQILEFNSKYEIIFVSTPMELLVNTVNEIKEILGRPMSTHPDIFRDKFLQRELIQAYNPELGIKFMKGTPEELDIIEIKQNIGFPFILKPIDGLQSSGVAKINNVKDFNDYIKSYELFHNRLKNRGVDNKILIAEEFIDGQLYSIDYYVSSEVDIVISKPVKVKLGVDIGIEDYCNIARIATEKTENEFKGKRLKTFITSTVKATGIKNIFVHHEFKINSKGEFKTIELNGRIGGGRLNLMKRAYGLNMFEFLVNYNIKALKIKENNIYINIYATKKGILKSFNNKLLDRIKERETVIRVDTNDCAIGCEMGLTKDGFVKLGGIKLASKNYKEIRKDFLYIKGKYKELLKIDNDCYKIKIENCKKGVFYKVRNFFQK